MFTVEIAPLRLRQATIEIPGSKSYTNRALILAALTPRDVRIINPLYSDDTESMINCLRVLGLSIEKEDGQIIVHDDISIVKAQTYELYAKDSGTTLRFLLPLLCIVPGIKILRGSTRLNERPIKPLIHTLRMLGAHIECLEKEGQAPLKIYSKTLEGHKKVLVNASLSGQFLSGLLMIAPYLQGVTLIEEEETISKSYVNMTLSLMRDWGINLTLDRGSYHIPPGQCYNKESYIVEADFSSASYFFAIAALMQSSITIKNLNSKSLQGDRKFLEILRKMGNDVIVENDAITIKGKQIIPLDVDMEECPDQVQTMAVLAAFAQGKTTISGVRSLRYKETERVFALKKELGKMGIFTEDTYDTLTIFGGKPHAAEIDTYKDHRMAMAFSIAGIKLSGMKIRDPDVVNKTFPTFWKILERL